MSSTTLHPPNPRRCHQNRQPRTRTLEKFGLQMHTGTQDKKSKTEILHIPRRTSTTPTDTSPIILSDGTRITFCNRFTYLGSIITSTLSDEDDINHRITKATQAFGSLRSLIFCNPYIPLKIKQYLYLAVPINLLLWGNENWALPERMLHKLESFHTKCCRAILGISMWEVSMYKVKNVHILARLNLPSMKKLLHYRRLLWIQKIATMPLNRNPRMFLNAWILSNRPVGRPNLTTRDSFLKSLQYCNELGIIKLECPNGKLNQWIPQLTCNRTIWQKKIDILRGVMSINKVDFYKTYQ